MPQDRNWLNHSENSYKSHNDEFIHESHCTLTDNMVKTYRICTYRNIFAYFCKKRIPFYRELLTHCMIRWPILPVKQLLTHVCTLESQRSIRITKPLNSKLARSVEPEGLWYTNNPIGECFYSTTYSQDLLNRMLTTGAIHLNADTSVQILNDCKSDCAVAIE